MSISGNNATITNLGSLSCSTLNASDFTLSSAGSGFGSLRVTGADDGGYNGVEIPAPSSGMSVVFANNGTSTGIWNDTDDEWLISADRNAGTMVYYNGATRVQTTNAGVTITGNITHDGLTMTSGTDVDQVYTTTVSIALVASTDVYTGIEASSFVNGTYVMQCYINNDGHNIGMYYSGMIPWVNVNANSADVITIKTVGAGYDCGSPNHFITFKMYLTTNFNRLYMNAPYSTTGSQSYQFKFRRLI